MWRELLEVDRISPADKFFDLGGDSLGAARVLARLVNELGVRLNAGDLVFHTLGQLAALCEERTAREAAARPGLGRRMLGAIRGTLAPRDGQG